MGKIFLMQWNIASDNAKLLCSKLLDLEIKEVERIIRLRENPGDAEQDQNS